MTSSRSRIAREWCLRRFWSGYAYKRHALADGCCDEAGELCTVEARSADQPAVYVWLLHQLADGFPLHGAAVEDPDASGDLLPSQLSERLADRGADLLRIRGGGDLAGADGPDG